jgi:GcrA cell cycle regulator
MNWTDERVETLKRLWTEGLSASQIAAQMGGVSRNAVIGKVHRLKLASRARSKQPVVRSKKPVVKATVSSSGRPAGAETRASVVTNSIGANALKTEYVAHAVAESRPMAHSNVVVPISRRLELTQLTETTCKWPIGDPLGDDFHFCGHESGDSGPYCGYHAKLAFQPSSERRRAR